MKGSKDVKIRKGMYNGGSDDRRVKAVGPKDILRSDDLILN